LADNTFDLHKLEVEKGSPGLGDRLTEILMKRWAYSRYKNIWDDWPPWNIHSLVLLEMGMLKGVFDIACKKV